MAVRTGWLLNASEATPGQSRQDTRLVPLGAMVPAGALSTRPGLIPGNNPMNLSGSGMSGTVTVGRAVVAGTSSQGAYPVAIDAATAVTVANGDPSNPRIDSLFLIVYDKLFDTSGNVLCRIEYVQGTAAVSPTAPNAPGTTNAALRLWDILVQAGASAGSPINWATALTDRRSYTSSVGGINPDGSTAGWYSGQYRDGGATTGLERYNGTAWEPRVYLGTAGQLVIGTDVNLKRVSANVLGTDDALQVNTDGVPATVGKIPVYQGTASAQLTISSSASFADVPGAAVTFTTNRANAVAVVQAMVDMQNTTAWAAVGICALVVDGTAQTAQINVDLNQNNNRPMPGGVWRVPLAAAGSHTLKLQGRVSTTTGAQGTVIQATHTQLVVTVYDQG